MLYWHGRWGSGTCWGFELTARVAVSAETAVFTDTVHALLKLLLLNRIDHRWVLCLHSCEVEWRQVSSADWR